jgi:hypothetical protein
MTNGIFIAHKETMTNGIFIAHKEISMTNIYCTERNGILIAH